jgi:hypothetical protein
MTRWGLWACAFVLALTLPWHVRAQVPSVDTTKPIVTQKPGKAKNKPAKFLGEVLFSNKQSMQVRGQQNTAMIHTFTYSQSVSARMSHVLAKGGYRYGDKVVIEYMPGSDIALRIRGKPSKAG